MNGITSCLGLRACTCSHVVVSVEEREGSYAKLVNAYYELATLFYEWGWGSSFHFSYRMKDESFTESIKVPGSLSFTYFAHVELL